MAKPERNAPIWVKFFVLFHVIAITVWALPQPPDTKKTDRLPWYNTQRLLVFNQEHLHNFPLISDYVLVTGFWQYWDMFAPNPVQRDQWCDADVVYKNGQTKKYQYPRIFDLPIPTKYIKERYRKFYERAQDSNYAFLWARSAQNIALLNYDDPNNPPVEIRMHRHYQWVAAPGKLQAKDYGDENYFNYTVDQKRLKAEKAEPL